MAEDLLEAGIVAAFTGRAGGTSAAPFATLNLGLRVGDDLRRVLANRRRVATVLGLAGHPWALARQVHGATVLRVAAGRLGQGPPEGKPTVGEADGLITTDPGVVLAVLTADCAPVLLADPEAGVVGAAHAGWKGALGGVVRATVKAMGTRGGRPQRMVAAVGPCIGPASYEVGPEFFDRFAAEAPWSERFFAPGADGRRMFDLPAFVLEQLRRSGVERAEWIGRDTFTEAALFFSNRRAFKRGEPDYGRQMSAIRL
ncbi:MAG TPA: peptidoglycan editing factor PgeF [Actinomycetes bacterium]|nr:peptidoglycan editing factor PgeF [Actinomycetes bacterium]